jgi:glycosyltransferase involved in cell wall biosynthesis
MQITDRFSIYFKFIKTKIEIYKIRNFLKFCSIKKRIIKEFSKINEPKISIISAIYNREKFLSRLLKNLQYQNFKDIEIIFIDDFSKDNSVKIIKEFQKRDKRVILIRNRENKGTFVARNIGILYSKGKYINIPDPDDILSKDILKISFRIAKKFNYDIIRFNTCNTRGNLDNSKIFNDIQTGPIYQPDLSNYIFY